MTLDKKNEIGSGAFSVVFSGGEPGIAYKLFRSAKSDPRGFSDRKRKAIFDDEVRAYGLASQDAELRGLVPSYHGTRVIDRVVDSRRTYHEDESELYLLTCCYAIEQINVVEEMKLNSTPEWHILNEKFGRVGIAYMIDAQVLYHEDGSFKIIDFGTEDIHGNGMP